MVFFSKMNYFYRIKKFFITFIAFFISSCSTIDSTFDSISEAGDYVYDSIVFWEDDEPETEQSIIIEEAVQVPEFAMPQQQNFQNYQPQRMPSPPGFYGDPIYRSARQYFFVSPNGTPLPAPPPPPFPQYSIENRNMNQPYSLETYGRAPIQNRNIPRDSFQPILSEDEEMELYGIKNNCIRVAKDYMSGGFRCDDYDGY
jgi:hypothetical protein